MDKQLLIDNRLWACEWNYLNANKEALIALIARPYDSDILTIENGIAHISIKGPLYGYNYDAINEAISKIRDNDDISQVVLDINSPGGTVNNVDKVWSNMFELSQQKEIIAVNHGMMASAAYWIGSAAHKIIASSPVAETGSIGVYALYIDWSKYDEEMGIKEIRFVSSNAPLKNIEPSTEEGAKELQKELDAIERVFISRIAQGRRVDDSQVIERYGQGLMMIALDPDRSKKDALKQGLIDEVKGISFEQINLIRGELKQGKKKEVKNKMNSLQELYVEHPHMKAIIEEAINKGVSTQMESFQKSVEQALPILESASYSDKVKKYALRALKGEEGFDIKSIQMFVALADEENASENLSNAKAASSELPITSEIGDASTSRNTKTEEDITVRAQEIKAMHGVKE